MRKKQPTTANPGSRRSPRFMLRLFYSPFDLADHRCPVRPESRGHRKNYRQHLRPGYRGGIGQTEEYGGKGTVTEPDGSFRLSVPVNAVLEISSVNYRTQEINPVEGKPVIITLAGINKALNEVVVVGYGTAKRSDVTGSVSSVSKERLAQIPTGNVLKAIEGSVAGVNVSDGSNVPGTSPGVIIRGINSINGNTLIR